MAPITTQWIIILKIDLIKENTNIHLAKYEIKRIEVTMLNLIFRPVVTRPVYFVKIVLWNFDKAFLPLQN